MGHRLGPVFCTILCGGPLAKPNVGLHHPALRIRKQSHEVGAGHQAIGERSGGVSGSATETGVGTGGKNIINIQLNMQEIAVCAIHISSKNTFCK